MSETLKPCPFCGGTHLFIAAPKNSEHLVVACRDCGAEGPDAGPPNQHIAAWNTRTEAST